VNPAKNRTFGGVFHNVVKMILGISYCKSVDLYLAAGYAGSSGLLFASSALISIRSVECKKYLASKQVPILFLFKEPLASFVEAFLDLYFHDRGYSAITLS
jgi:hypothetical protein